MKGSTSFVAALSLIVVLLVAPTINGFNIIRAPSSWKRMFSRSSTTTSTSSTATNGEQQLALAEDDQESSLSSLLQQQPLYQKQHSHHNSNKNGYFIYNFTELNLTDVKINENDLLPSAPHLTYKKYLTMQEKRVVVTFRFSDVPYLKPYYLTFASKLKKLHPDLFIQKIPIPMVASSESKSADPIFEVLVDGKVIMGGGRTQERHAGRIEVTKTQSIFVSMEQISHAIIKARRKRRPTTLYGDDDDNENNDLNLATTSTAINGEKEHHYRRLAKLRRDALNNQLEKRVHHWD